MIFSSVKIYPKNKIYEILCAPSFSIRSLYLFASKKFPNKKNDPIIKPILKASSDLAGKLNRQKLNKHMNDRKLKICINSKLKSDILNKIKTKKTANK